VVGRAGRRGRRVLVEHLQADRVERLGAELVERGLLGAEHAGDRLAGERVDAEDLLAEEREDGDVAVELLGCGLILAERTTDDDLAAVAAADQAGDPADADRGCGDGSLAVWVGRVVERRLVAGGRIPGDGGQGAADDSGHGADDLADGADNAGHDRSEAAAGADDSAETASGRGAPGEVQSSTPEECGA
jgi:hypothetical protein